MTVNVDYKYLHRSTNMENELIGTKEFLEHFI